MHKKANLMERRRGRTWFDIKRGNLRIYCALQAKCFAKHFVHAKFSAPLPLSPDSRKLRLGKVKVAYASYQAAVSIELHSANDLIVPS